MTTGVFIGDSFYSLNLIRLPFAGKNPLFNDVDQPARSRRPTRQGYNARLCRTKRYASARSAWQSITSARVKRVESVMFLKHA
jgi:hypothetical protein